MTTDGPVSTAISSAADYLAVSGAVAMAYTLAHHLTRDSTEHPARAVSTAIGSVGVVALIGSFNLGLLEGPGTGIWMLKAAMVVFVPAAFGVWTGLEYRRNGSRPAYWYDIYRCPCCDEELRLRRSKNNWLELRSAEDALSAAESEDLTPEEREAVDNDPRVVAARQSLRDVILHRLGLAVQRSEGDRNQFDSLPTEQRCGLLRELLRVERDANRKAARTQKIPTS